MQCLSTGDFFGQTNRTTRLAGLTLTDTEYTVDYVDWHYHENAYFTFLLAGRLLEGNRKETYECSAGTLLFHHWQEPHYNIKPRGSARGFHVEVQKEWFDASSFDEALVQGSFRIDDPGVRIFFHRIYRESRINDAASGIAIESHLLDSLHRVCATPARTSHGTPSWPGRLKEILHDKNAETLRLANLSRILGVHPVHISRDFPKYFHCSFGEYLRKIRVEQSLNLFHDTRLSLTDIALECGFADQSHFIRCFKKFTGVTPSEYRNDILR